MAATPPPEAVCRYCFEGADEGELLSPCMCKGNQRWVHAVCLIKWQRRQGRGTTSCEVCMAPWTILLDALDREVFVRSVRTNPRYPDVLGENEGGLDAEAQAQFLTLMAPGTLILQTPAKAREHGAITLQTLQQQQTLLAAQRAGGAGAGLPGLGASASNLSLFANLLTLQRARHWLRGCYLIVFRGDGDATDGASGGDSLVAINLSRVAHADERERADADAQAELLPLITALGLDREAVAAGSRRLPLLIGGPCHQTQPLVLLEINDDAALPRRGDFLAVPLVNASTVPSLRRFEAEWSSSAAAAAAEVGGPGGYHSHGADNAAGELQTVETAREGRQRESSRASQAATPNIVESSETPTAMTTGPSPSAPRLLQQGFNAAAPPAPCEGDEAGDGNSHGDSHEDSHGTSDGSGDGDTSLAALSAGSQHSRKLVLAVEPVVAAAIVREHGAENVRCVVVQGCAIVRQL